MHLGTSDMSSGSVRRVSREDIQLVSCSQNPWIGSPIGLAHMIISYNILILWLLKFSYLRTVVVYFGYTACNFVIKSTSELFCFCRPSLLILSPLTHSSPNHFTIPSIVVFIQHWPWWCLFGSFQVQNLIERCLQLYMNPKEVVETLLAQAKIEPGFTELGTKETFLCFFTHTHTHLIHSRYIFIFMVMILIVIVLHRK